MTWCNITEIAAQCLNPIDFFFVITDKYLVEWKEQMVGLDESRHKNAMSSLSRCKAFLQYMAYGCQRISTWQFLDNKPRIRK